MNLSEVDEKWAVRKWTRRPEIRSGGAVQIRTDYSECMFWCKNNNHVITLFYSFYNKTRVNRAPQLLFISYTRFRNKPTRRLYYVKHELQFLNDSKNVTSINKDGRKKYKGHRAKSWRISDTRYEMNLKKMCSDVHTNASKWHCSSRFRVCIRKSKSDIFFNV